MTSTTLSSFCKENAPLAPLTWFKLGGPAKILAEVRNHEQLAEVFEYAQNEGLRVYILGGGANLLVSDDGVDGIVVRMTGGEFQKVEWSATGVVAGGGVDMARLALNAARKGLAGLECMAGIPGTVGGCIRMNAGGRFGDVGSSVARAWTVDSFGCRREWKREELGFRYRRSALKHEVLTAAEFHLIPSDPDEVRRRYKEIWEYKKHSQPLGGNSAGCVFKNPPGQSAGALIDKSGLKGAAIGGAMVSREHANFIVANKEASASHVMRLIHHVRQRVAERFGVELELEVQLWPTRAGAHL